MTATPNFFQTAWVVDDLTTAIHGWLDTTRVGPFFVIPHIRAEISYRGKPTELDTSVAWAQAGDMQIELIQQHNDGPSAYRDSVPVGHNAVHHIALVTDDFDAERARYQKAGIEVPYESSANGIRVVYFDTRATIGCMTELSERNPITGGLFSMVAQAAADWDGTDPVRQVPIPG